MQRSHILQEPYQRVSIISLLRDMGFPHSSVGKESTCNAGYPSLIPGSGRSPGERIGYPLEYSWAFPCGSAGKEYACNEGDLGSIPGLGRFPWSRERLPTPVFGLEISMDCIVLLLLRLSHFSRVRLCATPQTAAHQTPWSLGFSRQEHWSGLPLPSPMHESEK